MFWSEIEESERAGSRQESDPGQQRQLDNDQPSQSSVCTAQVVLKCYSRTLCHVAKHHQKLELRIAWLYIVVSAALIQSHLFSWLVVCSARFSGLQLMQCFLVGPSLTFLDLGTWMRCKCVGNAHKHSVPIMLHFRVVATFLSVL